MEDSPAKPQPTPEVAVPPWLLYASDSAGTCPAVPGGALMGMD